MAESCCNPFNLPRHSWSTRKKNLRPVKEWMCEKAEISVGSKICDSCRKKLAKPPAVGAIAESSAWCDSPSRDEPYVDVPEAMAAMNRCLSEIGETPLSKCESHPKHVEDKIEKVTEAMMGLFDDTAVSKFRQNDESEIILQLKEKFQTTTKRSEQLQILTILPRSWTRKQIQSEFGVKQENVSSLFEKRVFSLVQIQSLVTRCHLKL